MGGSNPLHDGTRARWMEWIANYFPPGQFGRYLVVGLSNTLFGYSTYALFTALLTPHIPYPYVVAVVLAYFFNVTFAFLNCKWFIFKTKGGYLREWARCIVVYAGTIATGTALLPAMVFVVRHLTPADRSAPYVAGAILMGSTSILGFLGHKNFTFAPLNRSKASNRAAGST
jgi:putative flippase GtrA